MSRRVSVRRKEAFHERESLAVLARVCRCSAVGRYHELEVAEIRIAGSEEYTLRRGQSRQDELSCIEVIEQDTERGFVKARVLGFEYEIVVGFGREQVGDIPSSAGRSCAPANDGRKVRAPAAKVVVYVHDRNAGGLSAPLQALECSSHRLGVAKKRRSVGKRELIDDINEEERHMALIRDATVEIASPLPSSSQGH